MNTEWEQINQLFHQALECTDEERAEFIARASQDDPALRREVQSLVAMHEENRGFLENPALRTSLSPQFGRWQQQIVDVLRPLASMVTDRMVGQLLDGKYQIEELCGRGGMGAVFRATHVGTGRRVAVKVIAPELAGNREFIERFRREAKTIGLLRHPNIVNVTDFGVTVAGDETTAYLVMEYLEGGTLAERLKTRRPMPLDETIAILSQVCEAMDEAHRHGILHRDLKPENIWLEAVSGNVKVLDFGIARLHDLLAPAVSRLDDSQPDSPESEETEFRRQPLSITEEETLRLNYTAQQLSRFGSVMGTPKYMSPEQGRGESLDKTSDVYSLGVIAYQMLAGDPPFAGSVAELLHQHRNAEPVSLREKRWKLPAGVEAVVAQALAKDPQARPATAGAFALLLRLHTEGNEWIRREAEEQCRKHRWKLIGLTLRMQWTGWLLACLSLFATLALPGMSSVKSVALFGALWLAIIALTIWRQNALTAACTLFLEQPNGKFGLRGIIQAVRQRSGDLIRASAIEWLSFARLSRFRRPFEKMLIVPALVREQLDVEQAGARSAAMSTPIRQMLAIPFLNRLLAYAWIPTAMQVGLVLTALVMDEGRLGLPESVLVLWLPVTLAISAATLLLSLKSAVEQAVLYLTARQASGELPLDPALLLPRPNAETRLSRAWSLGKTYVPACVLLALMAGFHLGKFPLMTERVRDVGVYSVKALHALGVPVPRWSRRSGWLAEWASDNPAMMKYLLEKGADVNAPIMLGGWLTPTGIGEVTSTPLMAALRAGSVNSARLLISSGANVTVRDSIGQSPMTIAIHHCPRAIELLLNAGADLNEETRFGTPLLTAARYQWFDPTQRSRFRDRPIRERDNAVRILLEKGANPNTRDREGRNALMVMSFEPRNGRAIELIGETLLNAGCDINAADNQGHTPLIYAIRARQRAAVNLLLKRGADIQVKDHNGESAVDWAKKSGNVEIAKLLMSLTPSGGQKHSR